ncbi:MAG TPA: hypothetical protein VF469_28100 [Kofleriaceae bacterium]
MTKAWLALALALAGCGRLGFEPVEGLRQDGGSDVPAGDLVTIVVTSDQYLAEVAGTPIAGATVLVERSGGPDRLMTDASGMAQFSAAGAIACHVVYKSDLGWRGYTVAAPLAGTIELGSRLATSPTHGMTFVLPASGNPSQFTVQFPSHCVTPSPSSTPSVAISYNAACEGTQGRLIGYALASAGTGPDLYVDAGLVTLANGGTYTVPGSYQALPVHPLAISNLPAATDTVTAEVLARSGLDLTALTPVPVGATAQGSSAMLNLGAVPGGNALHLQVLALTPLAYVSTSDRIAPVALAAQAAAVDARGMLPPIDSAMPGARAVSWTGGAGGTITIVEGIAGGVQWDLYLDPSATSARVPDLPADLGVPVPGTFDFLSIVKLDVPGATLADLLPTIDRRWPSWPHDPLLLPPAGGAMSRLLYLGTQQPPVAPGP